MTNQWIAERRKKVGSGFNEDPERTSTVALFLGSGVILASILIGRRYAFFVPFLVFSVVMALLWRKSPRPWVFLVSVLSATPVAIARQQFACCVICASWSALLDTRYFFRLPRWVRPLVGLALFGVFSSAINWMSDGHFIGSILRQGAFAVNFILAPFLLLPLVYSRMSESRDDRTNLKGLLFCLIAPSALILLSARLFGTQINEWEASLHAASLSEGFIKYQLGKAVVDFLRPEVGFILAALICASTAIVVSKVKILYRGLAAAFLASSAYLLLVTASFGSISACLCGCTVIFLIQLRTTSFARLLLSVAAIFCMFLLIYTFLPPNAKTYLGKRYEHRVTDANDDRVHLWGRAVEYYFQHPGGVGFTLSAGDDYKTYIHNDYLAYTVSYGIMGGLAYTWLLVGLAFSFLRMRKPGVGSPESGAVYLAGLGVVIAAALNSITDHMTENRWYFSMIWSLIWYTYFCSSLRRRSDSKNAKGEAILRSSMPIRSSSRG